MKRRTLATLIAIEVLANGTGCIQDDSGELDALLQAQTDCIRYINAASAPIDTDSKVINPNEGILCGDRPCLGVELDEAIVSFSTAVIGSDGAPIFIISQFRTSLDSIGPSSATVLQYNSLTLDGIQQASLATFATREIGATHTVICGSGENIQRFQVDSANNSCTLNGTAIQNPTCFSIVSGLGSSIEQSAERYTKPRTP